MCFAHDSSFCGRSRGGFRLCGGEAGAFRSPPPPLRSRTYKLVLCPTLAGRGGSVSRRDHNQAYRRRAQLSGGTNSAETTPPNASRSSGEGVWGRGASLREAASPPESPNASSFREGARGRGIFCKKSPLPRKTHYTPNSPQLRLESSRGRPTSVSFWRVAGIRL